MKGCIEKQAREKTELLTAKKTWLILPCKSSFNKKMISCQWNSKVLDNCWRPTAEGMKNEHCSSIEKKVTYSLNCSQDLAATRVIIFSWSMISQLKNFWEVKARHFFGGWTSLINNWIHKKKVLRSLAKSWALRNQHKQVCFGINTACLAWEAARDRQ